MGFYLQDLGFRWKTTCTSNLLNLGIAEIFRLVFSNQNPGTLHEAYVPTTKKWGAQSWRPAMVGSATPKFNVRAGFGAKKNTQIEFRDCQKLPQIWGNWSSSKVNSPIFELNPPAIHVWFFFWLHFWGSFSLACSKNSAHYLKVVKIELENLNTSKNHSVYLLRRECAYLTRFPCSAFSLCLAPNAEAKNTENHEAGPCRL